MSGGYFDHEDEQIGRFAHIIGQLIANNDSTETDEYGGRIGNGYHAETIKQFQSARALLEMAQIYVHRIDWLVSGDDSEESFHRRLDSDLAALGQQKENTMPITDDHGQANLKQYRVIEQVGNWYLLYDQYQIGNHAHHEFRIQKLKHDIALYPGISLSEAQQRFREKVGEDNE